MLIDDIFIRQGIETYLYLIEIYDKFIRENQNTDVFICNGNL